MSLSPIVLFTYNRLWHTRQTVEALLRNKFAKESELFIFSDGAKGESDKIKVLELREYLKTIRGFKNIEIIEREENLGLVNNVIDGVTRIVNEFGKVIVLEDDLVTSPYFLNYMNKALEMYQDEEKVASIHGYVYPLPNPEKLPETFFIRGADCWGWGTWKRAWKYFELDGKKLFDVIKKKKESPLFDFNGGYPYTRMLKYQIKGKSNSWAILWYASAFVNNMLTLYPRKSLVKNIGFDNTGTHPAVTEIFDVEIAKEIVLEKIYPEENMEARRQFEVYLKSVSGLSLKKIYNFLKKRFL